MKRRNFLPLVILFIIASGTSLAIQYNKKLAQGDVYFGNFDGHYILVCTITPPTTCTFATTTGTSGRFFTQPTSGTYVQLPDHTPLYELK